MGTIIIDQNYPGIKKHNHFIWGDCYLFDTDMYIDGDCEIKLDKQLIVEGDQIVKGHQRVEGYQRVMSVETSYCIRIAHLTWAILILENHIKIGCEFHTKEDWAKFTDAEIDKMDSRALDFWNKHKSWVLNINPKVK